MKRFLLIPVTFGLLLGLWVHAAQGADRTETVKKLPNGSVERCVYETSFETAKDGGTVIVTAWRCVVTRK